MYVKLNNGVIDKYPYSIASLHKENVGTSFPAEMPNERLAEWEVYPVQAIEKPVINYKQNVIENTPINENGVWKQVWTVQNKPLDEINAIQEFNKKQAYIEESDPLFFKWQRGEIDKQVWLDKVAEIKQRWI